MKINKEYIVVEFNPSELDGGFGPSVEAYDIATLEEAKEYADDKNKVIYKQVVLN